MYIKSKCRYVQVSHLRARLQTDPPVYFILHCDARINNLSVCAFAKVTPVNLKQVLKTEQKHKVRKIKCELTH